MSSNLAAVVTYYQDLLLLQYKWKPRARANIGIYAKQATGDLLIQDVAEGFGIDTAVGAQLDILGKYVGVPRDSGPPEPLPYFGFWDYETVDESDQNPNGMTDYEDAAINAAAVFYSYTDYGTRNTDLTDSAYRLLIKLKIILNSSNGTLASIQQYLKTFFPGLVALTDNSDMTLTYTIQEGTPLPLETLKAYLPKPMGVGVNYITFTASTTPVSLSGLRTGSGSATVTTSTTTNVTTTNGVGPYAYSWRWVSGDTTMLYYSPGSGTDFSALLAEGETKTAVFECVVTDSRGLVAVTQQVTVTLINDPP